MKNNEMKFTNIQLDIIKSLIQVYPSKISYRAFKSNYASKKNIQEENIQQAFYSLIKQGIIEKPRQKHIGKVKSSYSLAQLEELFNLYSLEKGTIKIVINDSTPLQDLKGKQ